MLTALLLPAATRALTSSEVQSGPELPARLTAKHPKLDSELARLADSVASRGRLVRVEAVARGARRAELEAAILAAGGRASSRYAALIDARIPVQALESLAAHPAARQLRSPTRPQPQVVSGQGIASTGAAAWHAAQTAGAGVEIAIVDVGFAGWQDRQAEGELPDQVATADFCDGGLFDGPAADDHGSAVAEIVHELAPAAKLHLVCIDTLPSLGEAKDYVVANDIPIVNHSVGWLNTSRGDGTGPAGSPAAIVADARAQGVLWVNAAGNYAQTHWSGTFSDPDADDEFDFHNFSGADEGNQFAVSGPGCIFLKWDDWPATDQDFDLYVFRSADDELIAFSEEVQNGTQEPFEELCYEDPGFDDDYYVSIVRFNADESPRFDLFAIDVGTIEYSVPGGSLIEPASSPAALAVGAVCWQNSNLEPYSSRGPAIGGGTKPDISGPDAVSTATYGASSNCAAGFGGTSASVAHVTAAAALIKQANPSFGPAELQVALESRTGLPDAKNNDVGAGSLALGTPPPTPPTAPSNSALPTISGLFHEGQTLTASDGQWVSSGAPSFAFRWLRCNGAGDACDTIAGARSRTYVSSAADLGHVLRVRVTASNPGGSNPVLSVGTPQIQPPIQPPANVIPPSVAGVAQFGHVLSAGSGAWSGTSPLAIAIEWLRCSPAGDGCGVIPGAVAATYQLGLEDIGFTLRVRVTAANPADSSTVVSNLTGVVLPPLPMNVSLPTIPGPIPLEGQPLTATFGTWSFATSLTIQWRRCAGDGAGCTDIPGAAAPTYSARVGDAGGRLQVVVTATNAAGSTSATSAPTPIVTSAMAITLPTPLDRDVGGQTRLIVRGFSRSPNTPQAGRRFTLVLQIGARITSTRAATRRVTCSAKIGKRALRPAAKSIRGAVAKCVWAIPKSAAGKRLQSGITVSEGARSVRRNVTATVRPARLR